WLTPSRQRTNPCCSVWRTIYRVYHSRYTLPPLPQSNVCGDLAGVPWEYRAGTYLTAHPSPSGRDGTRTRLRRKNLIRSYGGSDGLPSTTRSFVHGVPRYVKLGAYSRYYDPRSQPCGS